MIRTLACIAGLAGVAYTRDPPARDPPPALNPSDLDLYVEAYPEDRFEPPPGFDLPPEFDLGDEEQLQRELAPVPSSPELSQWSHVLTLDRETCNWETVGKALRDATMLGDDCLKSFASLSDPEFDEDIEKSKRERRIFAESALWAFSANLWEDPGNGWSKLQDAWGRLSRLADVVKPFRAIGPFAAACLPQGNNGDDLDVLFEMKTLATDLLPRQPAVLTVGGLSTCFCASTEQPFPNR